MSKNNAAPAQKKVDVVAAAHELAACMKEDPSFVEKELIHRGDELLAFFQDGNFRDGFQNLRQKKIELIGMAIQDISSGVMTLRTSSLGVSFRGRDLAVYVSPLGTTPQGTIVYSINWKNVRAFHNWRADENADVSQDEINTAIYRLAAEIAKLTP